MVPQASLDLDNASFQVGTQLASHRFDPILPQVHTPIAMPGRFGHLSCQLTTVAWLVDGHIAGVAHYERIGECPITIILRARIVKTNIAHNILIDVIYLRPDHLLDRVRLSLDRFVDDGLLPVILVLDLFGLHFLGGTIFKGYFLVQATWSS